MLAPLSALAIEAPDEDLISVSIPANKVQEECFEIAANSTLQYYFNASAALNFNLHYHRDKETLYPVVEKGIANSRGNYKATIDQVYCVMWTNKNAAIVKLDYTFEIVK